MTTHKKLVTGLFLARAAAEEAVDNLMRLTAAIQ